MRNLIFFFLLACGLLAAADAAEKQPQPTRKKLAQDTAIQGYPCQRGYAWFYQDGKLNRCTVWRATAFGEAQVPAGSIIELWPDGTTNFVMLAHDAVVDGYNGMGGGPLGPAEGAITSFYRSGRLHTIYLVADQTIQGVPCRGGQLGMLTDPINGGNFVEFYENGALRSCKLTRDFGGQKRGHRLLLKRRVTSGPST